jgi:hypothetical protein
MTISSIALKAKVKDKAEVEAPPKHPLPKKLKIIFGHLNDEIQG